MDMSAITTQTQLFLLWILSGFLLIWMITFTLLALRPEREKGVESAMHAMPTHSVPIPAAAAVLHVVATQPSQLGAISHESTGDIGATSLG